MKKRIKKVLIGFDDLLTIPQSYSFIVSASHGVGLHAFLYQLSQCVCNGRQVYPLPWAIFAASMRKAGLINLGFHRYFLNNKVYSKMWGLTFDGERRRVGWLEKNCQKTVPTFCLIRDPVLVLTTCVNYLIAMDIFRQGKGDIDEFCRMACQNRDQFKKLFAFYESSEFFLKNGGKTIFVDTVDFSGQRTIDTFKNKLFFDFHISQEKEERLALNVNGAFERLFPKIFSIDGVCYTVSPLPDAFVLGNGFSRYCLEEQWNFEYEFVSPLFSSKKLYVFSKHHKAQEKFLLLKQELDIFLEDIRIKMDQYEKSKFSPEDSIELLKKNCVFEEFRSQVSKEVNGISKIDSSLSDRWDHWNRLA